MPKQEQPISPTGCAGSGGCSCPGGTSWQKMGALVLPCALGGQQRPQAVQVPCAVEISEITLLVSFHAGRAHGQDSTRSLSLS